MERNPMAGGGMLVQPSADGRRPGYQGKKPFEKVTIDGKVYKKNPDTGLISFRTTDKNREYKMLRLTPEEVKKRILLGEDIIGRNEKYKVVDIDENFPNFIKKNIDKYKNWII